METDAEQVVKCLKDQIKLSEIWNVSFPFSHLQNFSLSFIPRKKNIAAHSLVGLAKSIGTKYWMGIVPNQIYHILCNDFVLT
jgi:hypothetical protein